MNMQRTRARRDWAELSTLLQENQSFVFSTHLEPDADGLGAELGLYRYLKSIGKDVYILNPSKIRTNLHFLTTDDEVLVYDPDQHRQLVMDAQIFIAFDIGNYNRLMDLCPALNASRITKISIDHHPGDKSQFDLVFDDPTASSTGVMIYDLLKEIAPTQLDQYNIAHPLYAAMMSDTGNFRFNNTDPETLQAAAHLVGTGVKPYELYVELYENLNTRSRLYVLRQLLDNIQFDCDGRLAWSVLDFADLARHGVQSDDLHSLSDFIRSIYGVEIGASITQMPGQPVDVSLRSKGQIPVNAVAKHFDGGGHAFAAGCRLEGSLEESSAKLVEKCRSVIRAWDQEQHNA